MENRKLKERSGTGVQSWIWVLVICGVLGVFAATQMVLVMRSEGMHHAWVKLFFMVLLWWMPWAVWGPWILWLGAEYPLFQGSSAPGWGRHAGLWCAVWVGTAAWSAAVEDWLNPWLPDVQARPFVELWRQKLSNLPLESSVLYAAILLLGWMLDSRERLARQKTQAAQLSEQLMKAQLNALRQQIEPHFLFNTLNTIAGLVREGRGDSAVDMIAGLSEMLRKTLRSSDQQQVVLGEELEIAGKYLEIEKARFAERLQVRVEVAEELRRACVPSLILQPMVENAVKHGIAKKLEGGEIAISAARENGELRLSVRNDGPGFAEGWESKKGIGLENVRERLSSLYGDKARLLVSSEDGAIVTIVVPYREEENRK